MPEVKNDTTLYSSVVKTLLYYNIFNYPLKATEVFNFLHRNGVEEQDVKASLEQLTAQKIIFSNGELYSIQRDPSIFSKRIIGNEQAKQSMPLAFKVAQRIGRFPFVRAVMASGSLSKDYMDDDSDLDFFVITAPRRVWITRLLLALYKRLFLRNTHKLFCTNYFIDTDHLEIEEKNLFTATELATLIPLYGHDFYPLLMDANKHWVKKQFPNCRPRPIERNFVEDKRLKTITETVITVLGGSLLNRLILAMARKRWRKLYQEQYKESDFRVAFKSEGYVSKNHPRNFQKKVIELYEQQLKSFENKFEMNS